MHYSKKQNKRSSFFKRHGKCIIIRKTVKYLETDVATKLPQIHTVTGYYTTSSLQVVRKIKVLKRCRNGKQLRFLNTIVVSCKVSEAAVTDVERFIQTVCCSAKEEMGETETRVRLYKQMKTKTAHSSPPDEKLILQTFKRILYKVYYW